MKLTHASSYAIAALVYLAREEPGATVPSHHIAQAEGIPKLVLLKNLKALAAGRILRSVKGFNGSYVLVRDAKDVTLLEVVELVNGPLRALADPVPRDGGALDRRLQAICDGALALVRERLAKVTLAELAKGK